MKEIYNNLKRIFAMITEKISQYVIFIGKIGQYELINFFLQFDNILIIIII